MCVQIVNMTHGERYSISLETLSEGGDGAGEGGRVASGEPLWAAHTVRE